MENKREVHCEISTFSTLLQNLVCHFNLLSFSLYLSFSIPPIPFILCSRVDLWKLATYYIPHLNVRGFDITEFTRGKQENVTRASSFVRWEKLFRKDEGGVYFAWKFSLSQLARLNLKWVSDFRRNSVCVFSKSAYLN